MSSRNNKRSVVRKLPQKILPKKDNNIFYIVGNQTNHEIQEIKEEPEQKFYQIIKQTTEDISDETADKEYTETITIVSEDVCDTDHENNIVYVTEDPDPDGVDDDDTSPAPVPSNSVAFMQVFKFKRNLQRHFIFNVISLTGLVSI